MTEQNSQPTPQQVEEAFEEFLVALQQMMDKAHADIAQKMGRRHYYEIEATAGKRYWRVWTNSPGSHSCYAFVDRSTGLIYKPATYKAPAKHARGSILADNPLACCGPHTVAYLR